MGTIKKFRLYFIMFIGFFLLTTFLTNYLMRDNYKKTNYEMISKSPLIEVIECKSAYSNGYIKGNVTNNSDELIPLKYLQVNLFNKDGVYLGSEYKEIKNIYPQEKISFDMSYNYINIDKVILAFTDEIPEKKGFNFFEDVDDQTLKIAAPIAGLLLLFTVLP